MFPSSGYFRGVNCPFFASGLCERPYCHFRHTRIEDKPSKPENGPSYSNVRPYQSGSKPQFSGNVQKDIASYSTLAAPEPSGPVEIYQTCSSNERRQETAATISSIPSFSETPQTLPEADVLPVKLDTLPKISGLPKPRHKSSDGLDQPSYIPTPKRVQLIVKGAVPSYNPTPKQTETSSKKSSVEYDPVKNFAFRDKSRSGEEDDSHTEDEVALLSDSQAGAVSDNELLPQPDVTAEARFSDEDCDDGEKEKTPAAADDDLTDSDEDVTQKYISKLSEKEKIQCFAELLTPSSYFTSKLNAIDRKLSTDSITSTSAKPVEATGISAKPVEVTGTSVKPVEDHKHKSTSSNVSSHKHHSSKHRHDSDKNKSSKHTHSSAKSISSSAKHGSKSSSEPTVLTSEKKTASTSSIDKSQHSSSSPSSSHSHSNHAHKQKDSNKSVKESSLKSSSHSSSKNSEKRRRSSSHDKVHSHKSSRSLSSSSSSVPKTETHKTGSSGSSNKSTSSSSILVNGHNGHKKEDKVKSSDKLHKHEHSSSQHGQAGHAAEVKVKVEQNGSTSSKKQHRHSSGESKHLTNNGRCNSVSRLDSTEVKQHRRSSGESKHLTDNGRCNSVSRLDSTEVKQHHHSSGESKHLTDNGRCNSVSRLDSTEVKQHRHSSGESKHLTDNGRCNSVSRLDRTEVKQERRSSTDRIKNDEKGKVRSSGENCKSVVERRISDITSNLFGEESEGSDSDVQIVDPPLEPPAPVYELSDSGSDLENKDEDSNVPFPMPHDFDMLSDTDTFDECLRIFQETERLLAKKTAKERQLGLKPETSKIREQAPKVVETAEDLLASISKRRTAHKSLVQLIETLEILGDPEKGCERAAIGWSEGSIAQTVQNMVDDKRPVKTANTVRPRLSPAEVMHNRIVEMQKRALLRAAKREGRESELPSKLTDGSVLSVHKQKSNAAEATSSSISSSLSTSAASLVSSQKKREAHTPNIKTPTKTVPTSSSNSVLSPNSFYKKTKTESSKPANPPEDKKTVTVASTASKTEKRKAHEPTQSNLMRPMIPAEYGAKVPTNIRQRYLNLIIDEYLKFSSEEMAFAKGQEEEQTAYNRASNKNIYLGLAVNAIKRIRTEALESQPSSSKKQCLGLGSLSSMAASSTSLPAQSHEATLGGSLAAKTSYTLHRSGTSTRNQPQSFSGQELYEHLRRYILTENQLRENGFPRSSDDGSNKAKIYKVAEMDKMLKENERTCRRCGKRFYVAKDGGPITVEPCVYHYASAYKKKVAGSIDSRYGCCNERIGTKGCQVAKSHVHERNKTDSLTGYMKTLPESPDSPKNYAVYSLDCEMVYTKAGLELARVTVIGPDSSVKYESLVKPDAEIIDYNTRFSGITEKDMQGVTTTLRSVQAVMLSMICDKTILIGHSLESDLQSLKLIHSTVVDTSIVFPHRLGLPYKRALRNLMVDYLQKIIQTDDGGHDSKEDAVACMQLMLYKVKNDNKKR